MSLEHEKIIQLMPLSDNYTPMIREDVDHCNRESSNVFYRDAYERGVCVCVALYTTDYYKNVTKDTHFLSFFAVDEYGTVPEPELKVVPTLYCPICHNRMIAFTDEMKPFNDNIYDHLKYKCLIHNTTYRYKLGGKYCEQGSLEEII